MTSYQFTCPDCRRTFAVTEPMRRATISNGCPVCGRPVATDHFTPEAARA